MSRLHGTTLLFVGIAYLKLHFSADGMLIMAQTLLNGSAHQVICYSILSLSNVAKELTGADAESLIRSTLGGLRK